MTQLQTLLETEKVIPLDGGMGTMLFSAGLEAGYSPELWNLEQPEQIKAIHRAYIEAGARVILTNSFGGNRFRLKGHNSADEIATLNKAAAQIAREAAAETSHPVVVAGSMGPTGEMLAPLGTMTVEEAREAFAAQASALAAGGVDLLWIETMSDLAEVQAAIEGARSVCDLPIAATMTFDTHGRTMMGVKPTKAMQTLNAFNLIAIGANCGNGPAEIESVIEAMHSANPQAVLIAKANAGLPKHVGGKIVYDGTPAVMAEYAVKVRTLGARLIGACCGSTPAHIQAIAEALLA